MKEKMSITVDEENLRRIEALVDSGRFRNKSHVLEYAIKRMIDEREGSA